MNKIICVGLLQSNIYSKMHDISRRCYSVHGISPTIHTSGGGNTEIKVLIHENEQTDRDI